jgi:hypothetical protein
MLREFWLHLEASGGPRGKVWQVDWAQEPRQQSAWQKLLLSETVAGRCAWEVETNWTPNPAEASAAVHAVALSARNGLT